MKVTDNKWPDGIGKVTSDKHGDDQAIDYLEVKPSV